MPVLEQYFKEEEFIEDQREFFREKVQRIIQEARTLRCTKMKRPLYSFRTRRQIVKSIKYIASQFEDKDLASSFTKDEELERMATLPVKEAKLELAKLFYLLWNINNRNSAIYS